MTAVWILDYSGGEYDCYYEKVMGVFSDPAEAMIWAENDLDVDFSKRKTQDHWYLDEECENFVLYLGSSYWQIGAEKVTVYPMILNNEE